MFPSKTTVLLAGAATVGLALAGCSNGEEPSTVPGTNPPVVTGDQGAPGGVVEEQPEGHGESGGDQAVAKLRDAKGEEIGTATFTKDGKGVKVLVTVKQGLEPGFHGMHIHANGVCDASGAEPFSSAGGHLQVGGHTGHPSSGDLVSIYIDDKGAGSTSTSTQAVSLDEITGKSIIIHAGADNFANIPDRYSAAGKPGPDEKTMSTGDAGARAACGVIKD
ncbi:superoxide dismutase family protein [Gordonia sp. (in: high G+C Gram-positive bacteria)]|uniref:superoxide dismutase family protein n=1 Tax=Gordonia sp. (in: high G+C Gram-positive bacteria) TaxID=84139 RepID=UPI0039E2293B